MTLVLFVPGLLLLAVFGIGVWRESRRFGLGLILCLAVIQLAGALTITIVDAISRITSKEVGAFGLLLALILLVLGIAMLGVFLIVNAFTMRRKEGLGLSVLLSARSVSRSSAMSSALSLRPSATTPMSSTS